jgi:acetoacetyl-CoA synthetase
MPSMPLYFWDDTDGARYREAYFDTYPGVWRHGDWVTITERGGVIVHGRSDATMNRYGVRMGSAEIYEVVDRLPEVDDALIVGVEEPDGGYWMPLFIVPAEGQAVTPELVSRIRDAIRTEVSPRHVPDDVVAVDALPHTMTGKRLEVPVKRLRQTRGTRPVHRGGRRTRTGPNKRADPLTRPGRVGLPVATWFTDAARSSPVVRQSAALQ